MPSALDHGSHAHSAIPCAGNCKSDLEGSDVARSKTPEFASRQQPMREAAKLGRLACNSVEGQADRG